MTDIRTLLQYRIFYNHSFPVIRPKDMYIALFNVSEAGPRLLSRDSVEWTWLNSEMRVDDYLQQLAVYSMIAICQGENYIEGAHLLPVGDLEDRRLLVISILTNNMALSTYQRYLHVSLFVPRSLLVQLPSITFLEDDLVHICKSSISSTSSMDYLELRRLKFRIINFLNTSLHGEKR